MFQTLCYRNYEMHVNYIHGVTLYFQIFKGEIYTNFDYNNSHFKKVVRSPSTVA